MNDAKNIFCLLALCLFVVGCGHIPTSDYPVEVKKVLHAPFERVWNSSIQVIEASKATIIAKDKPSGLITCKFPADKSKSPTYASIFIKPDPQYTGSVSMYLIPYSFSSYPAISYVIYPQEKKGVILKYHHIYVHKDYFSDVCNTFYDQLEDTL
ncbi:MAG TPA: hypothetical protein VJJ98_13485 [Sedimentisphaerales bacterium]|nr:hypothetical protein [Sedimentisphaerales bacterium]